METNEVRIIKKGSTKEEGQGIISSWKERGKSKKDFCNEYGINFYTTIQIESTYKRNLVNH